MQFDIIIAGLDSISARRWINSTLVRMAESGEGDCIMPLIDGGTEGEAHDISVSLWQASKANHVSSFPASLHAMSAPYVVVTSFAYPKIDMLTPPTAFPICTIANTPRLPEHCIEWASVLEWPKTFKGERESLTPADGRQKAGYRRSRAHRMAVSAGFHKSCFIPD